MMRAITEHKHSINCAICEKIVDERDCADYHSGGGVCEQCQEEAMNDIDNDLEICIMCGCFFLVGQDGNELGFCATCQDDKDFPYDLDKYYEDHDAGKVGFEGFETMEKGLLEDYRK